MLPSLPPTAPTPRSVFSDRQRRLQGYAYAALRSMELAAAWIASTPRTSDKVLLATKLGFDGAHLKRLAERIEEMFTVTTVPAAPAAYESNFARAASLTSIDAQRAFLACVSRDVVASIDVYLAEQSDCADEPSLHLIRSMRGELGEIADRLGGEGADLGFALVAFESTLDADVVQYAGTEPIPPLVLFPAREEILRFQEETPPQSRRRGKNPFERESLGPFFHNMFVDVEIPATEVCARAIVEFRGMPLAFKSDMARQAWDEARHALLTIDALHWAGAEVGDFPFHALVWRRYLQGEGLAEKIAIQQCLQEGNSCDKAVTAARALRSVGHTYVADLMDQIIADEVLHVRFGNRWVMHLAGGDRAIYEATMAAAEAKVAFPLGPVDEMVREMGGFPPWYIGALRERFERLVSSPPSRGG